MKTKTFSLQIPEFDGAFNFNWEEGASIFFEENNGTGMLKGNKAGLLSLANHLINLAQDEVPKYYHIHLDEYNSLEKGSNELIIEKDDNM